LGEVSYSIYLVHALILNLFLLKKAEFLSAYPQGSWQSLLISMAIVVPTVLAASFALFKWVETPGNDFGKHITRRRSALAPAE